MNFPLFVARRIRNTQETSFSKTVTWVGVGTISLGISIILIAFSILFGFKSAIQDKLTSFSGDIRVSKLSSNHSISENPILKNTAWENSVEKLSFVHHIQSHIQKPGILVGNTGLAGIVIKGIGEDMPHTQIKKNIIQGLPYLKDSQDVIISQILAKQLKTSLNKSLILYFLSQPERPRKVKITGIYETGLDELDRIFILADREWVQKMNGWSTDSLGSYEIILKKGADLNRSAYQLEKKLPTEWKLETIVELYPSLFDWMNMLDRNIVIFISLLLLVACFNLIATLWVLIMERIPMVGLLKALGSSQKQIRTIFWWNGFFILLRGLLIGNFIAMVFCYIQYTYQLIPLDPENYYMNSVPILWDIPTWIYVNVGTCLLVAMTITIPTIFIKKLNRKMPSITKIKNVRYLFMASLLFISVYLSGQNTIGYSIDLNKLTNDKLSVQVKTPKFKQDQIDFFFPKIVPGTYANYDFGRYISDFKAFDAQGKSLTVIKKNVNQYQIKGAGQLMRISYQVDDTWDSPEIDGEYVFEPAGTSFQKDTLFALNTHGFLGYFKGFEKNKIELEINKPTFMVGTSSLKSDVKSSPNQDIYKANSYYEIVDSPIMYAKPDTSILKIGNVEIVISLFTPNKTLISEEIAQKIKPLLEAQKNYLGGVLPIQRYAFLIILSDNLKNGSYGALEHAKSSFYYLPEGDISGLGQTILDICAHEFFHIVTPLNIHSEEIGNFDFNQPKMSKHLWLYEGLTEYAAHHMQLKYGLIKLPQFMQTIQEKWETMQMQFDDKIPFTEMSKKVLDTYKDQYSNVYQKGALLGFGLDLLLRKESNGTYGTQQMMQDLAKIYGPNKSFKDDELFDQLIQVTKFPSLKEYFNNYVAGNKKIPLNDWLNSIGYEIDPNKKDTIKTLGFDFQTLNINSETKRAFIGSDFGVNALGNTLQLKAKDELISVNQMPVDLPNFVKNTQQVLSKIKPGDLLTLEIARSNKNGGFETIKLAAPFQLTIQASRKSINELILPSRKQIKLREDWMKPNP